jgi:hypothetical protein
VTIEQESICYAYQQFLPNYNSIPLAEDFVKNLLEAYNSSNTTLSYNKLANKYGTDYIDKVYMGA